MMTPYARVKLSRERTAGVFPLPTVLDCLRYAICEMAEYDDAILREQRTFDKRNYERLPEPRKELGQALYMLLSAAVQLEVEPERKPMPGRFAGDLYFGVMADLVDIAFEAQGVSNYITMLTWFGQQMGQAMTRMASLAEAHGWEVDGMIDDVCAEFEAKHAPAAV